MGITTDLVEIVFIENKENQCQYSRKHTNRPRTYISPTTDHSREAYMIHL